MAIVLNLLHAKYLHFMMCYIKQNKKRKLSRVRRTDWKSSLLNIINFLDVSMIIKAYYIVVESPCEISQLFAVKFKKLINFRNWKL